jgi:HD-like signal output (HDOD) protein
MKALFLRLFAGSPAPPAKGRVPVPRAVEVVRQTAWQITQSMEELETTPDTAMTEAEPSDIGVAFFAWLVAIPEVAQAEPGGRETRALQRLDRVAADPAAQQSLLPRAAAVVPQLMGRLRDASVSLTELSQYVSRDMTLVAEVIRTANSAYYRRGDAVVDLDHAIRSIGILGLQSTVARTVLKPVFDGRGGDLVTGSAQRLWAHTERKAELCTVLARCENIDPLEGYLAGLVHNTVWSAVLRAIDGITGDSAWVFNAPIVRALEARRDRLFEIIAKRWQLSEGLTALAADVAQRGLASAASVQGRLLHTGDRLASMLSVPGRLHEAEPWLANQPKLVRECFENLRRARDAGPA